MVNEPEPEPVGKNEEVANFAFDFFKSEAEAAGKLDEFLEATQETVPLAEAVDDSDLTTVED